MSSTASSDAEILRVEGINLAFPIRSYKSSSLRDVFTGLGASLMRGAFGARDSLHVLKDIGFTLNRGERLALIGVNGSGKTSLCRCVAGIFRPTTGELRINGIRRAIFNAQVSIIPELTGRENAWLLARLLYPHESSSGLRELVSEALAFSELGSFVDVPYETYSVGMKSRLCLSLITAKSCDLLILDEVYDSTDEFFQAKMQARLQKFIEEAGAVIFVSHSPDYIRSVCNRAIVLHEGRIAHDGSVETGLKAYRFLNAPMTAPT